MITKIIKLTENEIFDENRKLKNLSPKEFGEYIYNCLKKCLSIKEEEEYNLERLIEFNNKSSKFLIKILKTPIEYFKEVINAFEKITNTKNIDATTEFLHFILLNNLKNKKEEESKIEYICSSKILNYSVNLCDKNNIEITKFKLLEYYSSNFIETLIVLSLFNKNKIIIENYFPNIDKKYLSGTFASIKLKIKDYKKIDIKKINYDLLVNKFSIKFLKEFLFELKEGILLNDLIDMLSMDLTEEEKIYLLLYPLFGNNKKKFTLIDKKFIGLLESIDQIKFKKIFNEHPYLFIKNEELEEINNIDLISIENVWNIIVIEKNKKDKELMERRINNIKKDKVIKKRI